MAHPATWSGRGSRRVAADGSDSAS